MRNIRYIGSKPVETAFSADTGIIWTPGMVETVLSEELAARMLKFTDVFQDAGNAKAATVAAPADLPGSGGASLTPEQTAAVDAVIAGTAAGVDTAARTAAANAATAAAAASASAATKAPLFPAVTGVTYTSGQITSYIEGSVTYTLTYDGAGRVSTVSDGTSTRTVTYNPDGTVAAYQ